MCERPAQRWHGQNVSSRKTAWFSRVTAIAIFFGRWGLAIGIFFGRWGLAIGI